MTSNDIFPNKSRIQVTADLIHWSMDSNSDLSGNRKNEEIQQITLCSIFFIFVDPVPKIDQ